MTRISNTCETWTDIYSVMTIRFPHPKHKNNTMSPSFFQPQVLENNHAEPVIPYPTAFPYGNGMVLHFYQQQESSTTKTVHKVINERLKTYV